MVVRALGNSAASFRDRFNRTGNRASKPFVVSFSASGGNVNGLEPGNGYKYHTFTGPGTFTVSGTTNNIEVLMVAGGGGGGDGGGGNGGGGGAGGVRFYPSLPISPGSYPISVGGGGNGAPSFSTPGTAGTPTTAFGKTATGGGHSNYAYTTVYSGGSGAATNNQNPSAGTGNAGGNDPQASPISEGNPGGPGGGGGAGDAGQPTRGGNGLQFPNFTGPLIGVPALAPLSGYYGGGGGSGFESSNSTPGGLGGGGNGASRYAPNGIVSTAGVQYSGGGGGGSSTSGTTLAQPGGSGIVIIRYLA